MSVAIKIENLYKEYRLGVIGHGTLYRDLQSWMAKLSGKEDPNTKLGFNSKDLDKGKILALKNVNLEINSGQVLGVIGANGAGKSTLLKIISRVTAPTRGRIKIKGRVASLLEVGTGFHPELTGIENIYLNGAINGMNKKEVLKKMDEIVNFAGVEKFLDTPVKRYSTGMYIRLGFSVAAHLVTDILLVDEVLAVGDVAFQRKALGKMQEVSENEGRTVFFVSHNMASISALCDRTLLFKKGELVEDGETNSIINLYLNQHVQTSPTVKKAVLENLKEEKLFVRTKLFEIDKICISGENESPKLDFNSNEEINVTIWFRCLKEVSNFRLGILVDLGKGEHILSSYFTDEDKMIHHTKLKTGEYVWKCKIPPNLFGKNQYYFTVSMLEQGVHHLTFKNIFLLNVNFVGYNNITHCIDAISPIKKKFNWEQII